MALADPSSPCFLLQCNSNHIPFAHRPSVLPHCLPGLTLTLTLSQDWLACRLAPSY